MRNTRSLLHHLVMCACVITLPLDAATLFAQQPGDSDSGVVYEIGNGVTAPKPVSTPNPEYSDRARKKKINGTVIVAMIVTPEGKVRDVTVIKSLERSLDQQAITAVRTWKFEPAMKDGTPVAVHLKAEVSFRLY
jgi:periplasmic protein TonB